MLPRFAATTLLLIAACSRTDRRGEPVQQPADDAQAVERTYARPAEQVFKAAVGIVKDLELRIDDDRNDKMGGDLIARRSNGDRVVIEVRGLEAQRTSVMIRTDPGLGPLGVRIHEKLQRKLGLGTAKASLLGGNTAEGKYDCTLARAATAAEAVVLRLHLVPGAVDVRGDHAVIDARQDDATPVRIRLDQADAASTKAVFTAGTSATPEARTLARRLKAEFERELAPPVRQ